MTLFFTFTVCVCVYVCVYIYEDEMHIISLLCLIYHPQIAPR